MTTLITACITFLVGTLLTFLIGKLITVPRRELDLLKEQLGLLQNTISVKDAIAYEKEQHINKLEKDNERLTNNLQTKEMYLAELNAKVSSQIETIKEQNEKIKNNESSNQSLNNQIKELSEVKGKFEYENISLKKTLDNQKKEIEDIREKFNLEFEKMANKIFEEKTTIFSKTSKTNIEEILNPLKNNLAEFKKKVEETYDKESKERFSLESKISELVKLNQQISQDATNLTKALKGEAKTQGNWGEMILESILEYSGLVKDREYFVQDSYLDNDGKRKQPDVIIKYPNDRHIIVDSKVSLTAYERFANCEDLEQQKNHLKDHIKSIRLHIDNLCSKDYDHIEKSLDFVFLFVPIEPAYMTAIQYDRELWSYAYQKRIVLISPTNLIVALKMISDIWKRENQNANALQIARRGEFLYDKFVSFLTDMEDIEKSINKASEKYSDAIGKLSKGRGNLIGQLETLKNMGLNPKKNIPKNYLIDNIEVKEIEDTHIDTNN